VATNQINKDSVLVINDTPDQLDLMSAILWQAGYHVLTAADGHEGLETAKREHPRLIISDVLMPYLDGIELCRMLRAEESLRLTPVLLVSAMRKDTASAVEGLQAGADDYLEAPYEPMHLVAKVARLVERAHAEEEIVRLNTNLERRVKELQALFDVIPIGIAISEDPRCERITANRAFSEMLVIPPDANASLSAPDEEKPSFKVYHEGRELSSDELPMQYAAAKGVVVSAQELDIVHSDGRNAQLLGYAAPLFDEQQKVRGSVGAFLDTTERKYLEDQLRQSQKLESVGKLAGGIAHDFNNLLTAILGQSALIMRQLEEDDPLRLKVEEIKKAGERAAGLTHQLLAFSRKQILQPKVIALNEVVGEADKLLRRLIGENIELLTMCEPRLGRVKADPTQISQIIINLAVNARDAMPEGGKLILETKNVYLDEAYARQHVSVLPGRYVMLAVSDTGHGMDAGTQKQIFEPFFTTKEVGKGTGLGLSTVYGIVKQSGGNIWVYSEVGRGTTFKIYLPMIEEDALLESTADAAPVPRGTETVLVVEDNDAVLGLTCDILEGEGYKVLTAMHGGEALQICQQHVGKIDLIITDVVMPGMGGRQLSERLSHRCAEVKVLYMSGYTDTAIVHHGVLDAGTDFIQKPFTPDALARKVREMLDSP
jgi:two-component system cell cycle sensor histidine kinase/response regulator CckA